MTLVSGERGSESGRRRAEIRFRTLLSEARFETIKAGDHPMKHLFAAAAVLTFTGAALAQSNIDTVDKHAWGENIGWTNWRDANGGAQGVIFGLRFAEGFVWGENVGWINLGDGSPSNGT